MKNTEVHRYIRNMDTAVNKCLKNTAVHKFMRNMSNTVVCCEPIHEEH